MKMTRETTTTKYITLIVLAIDAVMSLASNLTTSWGLPFPIVDVRVRFLMWARRRRPVSHLTAAQVEELTVATLKDLDVLGSFQEISNRLPSVLKPLGEPNRVK